VYNNRRPVINHHFTHLHASFWIGIEQTSNRRQNLVPDKTGTRFAWQTSQKSESVIGERFLKSIYGAGFWHMCHQPHDRLLSSLLANSMVERCRTDYLMPNVPISCLPPSRVDSKVQGLKVIIDCPQPGSSRATTGLLHLAGGLRGVAAMTR